MKRLSNLLFCSVSVVLFCLLPSCFRYYEVIKSEFPQGQEFKDRREIAYNYIRSEKVMDQFKTLAVFNVLWLSDDVRIAYADTFSDRRGKNESAREAVLKQQLEENRHWISFYVLADVRDKVHRSLTEKHSLWTMYLQIEKAKDNRNPQQASRVKDEPRKKVKTDDEIEQAEKIKEDQDDKSSASVKDERLKKVETEEKNKRQSLIKVEPLRIKEVELEPEYQAMLGYRFTLAKTAYLVRFPAKSLEGRQHFELGDKLSFIISSPTRGVTLTWKEEDLKKRSELLKDEDFYWI